MARATSGRARSGRTSRVRVRMSSTADPASKSRANEPRPEQRFRAPSWAWILALGASVGTATLDAAHAEPKGDPAPSVRAQTLAPVLDFDVRPWSSATGLPQDFVTSLALDDEGFLWIGTYGGLARFDGDRFESFNLHTTPELSSHRISQLFVARNGDLWIAPIEGAVTRRRGGRFESFADAPWVPSRELHSIAEGDDGAIWFGGRDLTRFADGRFERVAIELEDQELVVAIRPLGRELWLGTTHGVWSTRDGAPFTKRRLDVPGGVHAFESLGDEAVVVPADDELLRLDAHGATTLLEAAEFREARALLRVEDGSFWLGTSRGLFVIRGVSAGGGASSVPTWSRLPLQLERDGIHALLRTPEGATWVAANAPPLTCMTPRESRFVSFPGRGGVDQISSDLVSGVWARSSVFRHVVDGRVVEPPAGFDLNRIQAATDMLVLPHGGWVSADARRLHVVDAEGRRSFAHGIEPPVMSVFADREGRLWATGYGSIAWVEDGRVTSCTTSSPSDGLVRTLGQSADGTLWFGGTSLLVSWRDGVWRERRAGDGVPKGDVRAMCELANGDRWFSSYGNGLFRERGGELRVLPSAAALPTSELCGMVARGDVLWVNSNAGVFRVRVADLDDALDRGRGRIPYRLVRTGEGNGPDSCVLPDGRMFFATVNGLAELAPELPDRPHTAHAPILRSVNVDGERVAPARLLALSPIEQRLEFEYTAVDLERGDGLRFRYRLRGYDDRWIDAGEERTAVFTQVPAGDYAFEVEVRPCELDWEGRASTFAVHVEPRWHERRSVRIAALVGLLAAAWAALRWRVRSATERSRRRAADAEERARIERELRENQEKYRIVAESASDALVTIGGDGRIVYVNPTGERVLGAPASELLGVDLTERVPELREHARRVLAAESTPRTERAAWFETVVHRRDGTELPVEVSLGVHGSEGDAAQVTCILRDVSERRAAERERAALVEQVTALNSTLEVRIQERTVELEQTVAELEAFAYSVSHDLRAPVRHITSFARILAEDHGDVLPADAQQQLDVVESAGKRLGSLIDDLLALSRVGRCELHDVVVDHEALVDATWRELEAAGRTKGVEFHRRPLPRSIGDESLLRQLWMNLLDNALKYTSKSAVPRIEVESFWQNGVDGYRVRDNGVGFEPRQSEQLFVPFTRLHDEHDFPGTGVGLAIVKRVVERHGGTIRAMGVRGAGATFEFTLGRGTSLRAPAHDAARSRAAAR